jgi:DNA/RNA-binding domain of Phe-tRNA-synthetase-like protein
MLDVSISDTWKATYPGAQIGMLLVENVDNISRPTALDAQKIAVEAHLHEKYAGWERGDLLSMDILNAYRAYYKKFGNTYHVQLQLESILYKGKSLPKVSPLVDAGFLAEIETLVLTAAHDADRLILPLGIDITTGSEEFIQMSGTPRALKPNDMMMTDAQGTVCTILYGQDNRSPITPATRRALYVAYVPPGIAARDVLAHLEAIRRNVLLFAPDAGFPYIEVHSAKVI